MLAVMRRAVRPGSVVAGPLLVLALLGPGEDPECPHHRPGGRGTAVVSGSGSGGGPAPRPGTMGSSRSHGAHGAGAIHGTDAEGGAHGDECTCSGPCMPLGLVAAAAGPVAPVVLPVAPAAVRTELEWRPRTHRPAYFLPFPNPPPSVA